MESVEKYIDFMLGKLNELAFEHISYSDYAQMTDWLDEIRKEIKRLELEVDSLEDKIGDLLEYF